ncbi:hypothetical protein BKI52_30585 [marine bacterium AO1-C]|nr:hypothetical protein BKI52_30585 [marine bacterium AO1-C]
MNKLIAETEYRPQLERLLNSSDEANHHIAFQIMSKIGVPGDLHKKMTDQVSKIYLCLKYGFRSLILDRKVSMPDEFLQESIRELLDLSYDASITYRHLWQLETLTLEETPPRNHFTFGLEGDATSLEGLQFATQLKRLTILNHEIDENEIGALRHLHSLEHLHLQGISQGAFRMKAVQDWSPISHLSHIKELHLIENQLDRVNFLSKNLPHLQLLNLQKNNIEDLKDLVNNPAVVNCTIDLRNNPLEAEKVKHQIAKLEKRDIEIML